MKIKIIFINLFVFFLIFLTADLIFSNFVYKQNISHKCYEHDEDGKFYKVNLKELEDLKAEKIGSQKYDYSFGHTANLWKENIYLFGGFGRNNKYSNEVFVFDSNKITLTKLDKISPPRFSMI